MKKARPNELTIKPCNDCGLIIEKNCRLPEIKFYVESGRVLFWTTVTDKDGHEIEALQYLDPSQAMKLSKAMASCAITALKEIS